MGSTNTTTGSVAALAHAALSGTVNDTLADTPADLNHAGILGTVNDTMIVVATVANAEDNDKKLAAKINAAKAICEENAKETAAKINAVSGATTVVGVYRDDTGGLYLDLQFTTAAGVGPAPLSAGVHVARVAVDALLS